MSFSAAFSVKSAGFATRGAGAAGAGSGAAGAGSGAAATGAGGAGAGAGACSCAGAAGAGTLACVTAGCFAQPPARIRTATEVTATVVATDPRFIVIPPLSLDRSEEHTSELQSRLHLVCRLLLEKKKQPRVY